MSCAPSGNWLDATLEFPFEQGSAEDRPRHPRRSGSVPRQSWRAASSRSPRAAPGSPATRSTGGSGLSRNVAVDPFHRIGGRKGQRAGEHLVEGDAEGVEIAARIDRTIHSPGLFGCHVGERPGDDLGRFRRLALARQTRRDTKAREPDLAAREVNKHIGRLDVLMDEATFVYTGEARSIDRWRSAGTVLSPWAGRGAGRAARRQDPQAAAWSARVRAQAPAAAPPSRPSSSSFSAYS